MSHKINIVADENIPKLNELLGDVANITFLPGRNIHSSDLLHADALLVRSITRVDADLLARSALKFVGSCTIGTDHVDLNYLTTNNIQFSSAPGCNAAAVVDYVFAAFMYIFKDIAVLKKKTIGIVGLGQVGSRLQHRLHGLGIKTVACDPFKANAEASMKEILACDVVSLHVPLTKIGDHKTHHLIAEKELAVLKSGALLINTSRGSVVDNNALLKHLNTNVLHVVLDVYEDEPAPEMALLEAVQISTPHIAGYSLQGKIRGTLQVIEPLLEFFSIEYHLPDLLSPLVRSIQLNKSAGITDLIKSSYDISADSNAFKQAFSFAKSKEEKAKIFDDYRKNYIVRYESSFTEIFSENPALDKNTVKMLGFKMF